jgi:hypothetical protein
MLLSTKKWYIGCLILFFVHSAVAQPGRKGFYLVNSQSKIPVQEAFVQSAGQSFNATANVNGFVSFNAMPDTITQLIVSCIGYETKIIAVSELKETSLVYLDEKMASLKEVTVRASLGNGIFKTISDLDTHLRPVTNSQEVLRLVPGLFIGQHAGGGKAEQIFLRGFDIDHGTDIAISVDGLPVNMVSHAHGQGYADLHFVIPELIDRVNFGKGPYYADKGNFTTAGYIDFKLKDYLERSFVKAESGQFGTFRGIGAVNLIKPQTGRRSQSLYAAGEASFTKGFLESPQNFNRFNALLKYRGEIGPRSTLTATLTGFASKWNASGQIPERAVADGSIGFYGAIDDTEGGKTARYNASVQLLHNLSNGGVLRNQIYYTHYAFELYSNFTFYKEDPVNGDQIRQKEARNLIGYNGSYTKDLFIGGMATELKLGVQVRYDDVNDIELTRTKNKTIITNRIMFGDVDETNVGLYHTQTFSVSKKLEITPGLRADYFTNRYDDKLATRVFRSHSTIISSKLNFRYKLNDRGQLYLHNGRGFHSNDTRVAVQQAGRKVLPPAYGTDLGGVFKIGRSLVLQSALWYLWLDQEFVYVGDEGIVEPGGKTRRLGLDVSARYAVLKNLFADIDVSVANPRALNVLKEESYLPLAPRFTSVGGITYRKAQGWNGSLRYRFMDNRPANEANSVVAKGYFILDATVNYAGRNWEGGLSIQNGLNTKWKETQFDTESRLQHEAEPISEIHFTPGTPFFARASLAVFF